MKIKRTRIVSVLIVVLCILPGPTAFCQFKAYDVFHEMKETDVLPKMDELDAVALSPDGKLLAHLHTDFDPSIVGDQGRITVDIHDVATSKVVATYQMPRIVEGTTRNNDWLPGPERLRYCEQGNFILASSGPGRFRVLDTRNYEPRLTVNLNAVPVPASLLPGKDPHISLLTSCSDSGKMVFHMKGGRFGSGFTIVDDLDRVAEVVTGLDEISTLPSISGATLSDGFGGNNLVLLQTGAVWPDGKFADSVIEWSFLVIDLKLKTIVKRIPLRGSVLKGDFADVFATQGQVGLERDGDIVRVSRNSTPAERLFGERKPSFHMWQLYNGVEEKPIEDVDPDYDGLRYVGMSDNGNLLAYTCKKKSPKLDDTCTESFEGSGVQIRQEGFSLWDNNGLLLAQSPSLKIVHHGCGLIAMGCSPWDEVPRMALDQRGNAILVYWPDGTEPVQVYTLQKSKGEF